MDQADRDALLKAFTTARATARALARAHAGVGRRVAEARAADTEAVNAFVDILSGIATNANYVVPVDPADATICESCE